MTPSLLGYWQQLGCSGNGTGPQDERLAVRSPLAPLTQLLSEIKSGDFPGGAVVSKPPASAGDSGSIPDPGGSHVLWSNQAREPQLLRPASPRVRALQQEKHHNKRSPRAATKTQHSKKSF